MLRCLEIFKEEKQGNVRRGNPEIEEKKKESFLVREVRERLEQKKRN